MSDPNTHVRESLLTIDCEGDSMMGIAHVPDEAKEKGIILVVGGPQYRVGSHRQFVLLARELASHQIPVLRFDYRGMGDSSGASRDFEAINHDIQAAINEMSAHLPDTNQWVLWGLCDAATASVFYAPQDPRITGLVLLNPWVRTEEGESQAYLKHYYLQRILSVSFWKKLLSGAFQWKQSWQSFKQKLNAVFRRASQPGAHAQSADPYATGSLPDRMLAGLQAFSGRVLFILSGNDLTAKEFEQVVTNSEAWQCLMASESIYRTTLKDADHTFSRRIWREQVARTTLSWMQKP